MASTAAVAHPSSQSIPRLAEPFDADSSKSGDATPRVGGTDGAGDEKKKKRSLFGFGKKKTDDGSKSSVKSTDAASTSTRRTAASPIQTGHRSPSSPGRGLASSPRLASPAGSQIFERDVQESSGAPVLPNSPAIPSHIQTENYIPPVLDASSEAITDERINPDTVEIITHTSHQPASVTVTGVAGVGSPMSLDSQPSWTDELAAFAQGMGADRTDNASNYGSLDTTDVRRLSFISFADVVQAEQAHNGGIAGSRDSMHLAGLTSLASVGINRSPSPIRSPVSSAGGGPATSSPPTSKSGSIKGLEISPGPHGRKPLGSPTISGLTGLSVAGQNSPTVSGELAIETMSQALRRTGSGDLSGVRSLPQSPV